MAAIRVKFNQQFASYNAGETGWFSGGTAQALVTAQLGTALDALPATSVTPAVPIQNGSKWKERAYVTRGKASVAASSADSDINLNEAAIGGGAG